MSRRRVTSWLTNNKKDAFPVARQIAKSAYQIRLNTVQEPKLYQHKQVCRTSKLTHLTMIDLIDLPDTGNPTKIPTPMKIPVIPMVAGKFYVHQKLSACTTGFQGRYCTSIDCECKSH